MDKELFDPLSGWPLFLRCDIATVRRFGQVPTTYTLFSHGPNEPAHVHVDRDDHSAKFWLKPVVLALNLGFSPVELRRIQQMLRENENDLMGKMECEVRRLNLESA